MTKRTLFTLWGVLFALCAGLGFLPEPGVPGLLAALVFFLPPAALLLKHREKETLLLVRNVSALSLGLTAVLLTVNFAVAFASEAVGTFVHVLLAIVSAPMLCSGRWAMSLFFWACLLLGSHRLAKRK